VSFSPIAAAPSNRAQEELLQVLRGVPDPRDRRGRRYLLAGILAVAVSAVLAGARSCAAIGEWVADLDTEQLTGLGLHRAPEESTMRKLFARLDAAALERQLSVWAWCRTRSLAGRRVIAIDGKTVRGARTATSTAPHLLSVLDHATGVVLGQHAVADKTNEIPAVRELLAGFDPADLRGCVVTVDAMHTQSDTAQAILAAEADYVFTVKGNQPKLLAALKQLPWRAIPVAAQQREHGHGRRATRTLKVTDVPDWITFTGAAQIAQLRRTTTRRGRRSVEVVYLITSADRATAPATVLAAWVQGHWGIENRLHWVRDVTFDEDRSQTRAGAAPHIMAALRNTAINILRLAGATNIAAALRHHARHTNQAITHILTC